LIRATLVGLAVVGAAIPAQAEEVSASTSAPTPSPAPGGFDRFAAPTGQLGAGLNSSVDLRARAFLELGFGHSEWSGPFDAHLNALSWILGGGYRITPNLELVAMLPMGWASVGADDTSESGVGFGNLHLGVNYLSFGGPLRFMAGGAVQFGPWYKDYDSGASLGVSLGHALSGGQDAGLYLPETVTIVAPGRVEYEIDKLVLAGDAALGVHIPTDGGDVDLSIQLSPGAGYYVTPTAQVGLRLPFTWVPTRSGSSATYFAMEPYGRFDFGNLFLSTRLTLNIDDPYGFAFDNGKFWALHVGFGGAF